VSQDATLRATVAEVELDPTSETVARNVARKVAPCVRALIVVVVVLSITTLSLRFVVGWPFIEIK